MKRFNHFCSALWRNSNLLICLFANLLILSGCKKDDNPTPEPQTGSTEYTGNYLLETSVANPDGMSGSSYLQLIQKLSGTTTADNSKAEQIEFGSSVQVEGNDVYLFDTMKGVGGITHYTYNPATQRLTKGANLPTPQGSMVGHFERISATKAYLPLYTMGVVWIINPQTMQKTGEINLTQYAHGDSSPDPAMGLVKGDKYYLCLDQVNAAGGWQPYTDYQQSDVLIINTQTDLVEKVVSETTSGLTFPTRPMSYCKGMIFTTENEDMYMACVGYFGFNPNNKKCGFICIPKGTTEFDGSKSWDISITPISGSQYKASTILNTLYIGGGKVVAYVGISELYTQNPYTSKSAMAVLIDLNAKTIKQIEGIPLTDGHSVFIGKLKDQVIFAAFGSDKRGLFAYNPTTGKTEQILSTIGNPAFFHAW